MVDSEGRSATAAHTVTVYERGAPPARTDAAPPPRANDGEQVRRAEEERQRRAEEARLRKLEEERLARERELRELRTSLARWREDLRCLEEGKRKYPKYELSCHGNWLLGSRDAAIERLRRNTQYAERRLAAAR